MLQKSLVGDDREGQEGHGSIKGMKKQLCHVEEVDQTSTSPGNKQLFQKKINLYLAPDLFSI